MQLPSKDSLGLSTGHSHATFFCQYKTTPCCWHLKPLKGSNDVLNVPSLSGARLNQQDSVFDLKASFRLPVLQFFALEEDDRATRHCAITRGVGNLGDVTQPGPRPVGSLDWYLSEVPVDPQASLRGLFAVVQAGLRVCGAGVG